LGQYWFSLPWPKYNFEKAEKAYLNSLKYEKNDGRTLYYLAELFVKEKKFDKAKEYLNKLESAGPVKGAAWEQTFYKKAGQDLMADIKNK